MFNLPFPTDSLYKFSFMFGLVLIVFSFYFRDKQLNKFDTKQAYYKIDSLTKWGSYYKNTIQYDSSSIAGIIRFSVEFITFKGSEPNKIPDFKAANSELLLMWHDRKFFFKVLDTNKFILNDIKLIEAHDIEYKERIQQLNQLAFHLSVSYNEKIKAIAAKKEFYTSKLKEDTFYFKFLLFSGFALFLIGAFFWYFLIQKPQDKILQIQLREALKKDAELNSKTDLISLKFRRHFEPQMLPRPQVRNRT